MSDVTDEPRALWLPMALFTGIAVALGIDLVEDYRSGSTSGHLLVEALAAGAALAGAVWLLRRYLALRGQTRRLMADLSRTRDEAVRWREQSRELLAGLGRAVDEQFVRWGLTPAEKEIALLLLKGLSHKEAAQVRKTSERTARQQALAVYRKAGIGGRAELSAFFFEDLLLPHDQRE